MVRGFVASFFFTLPHGRSTCKHVADKKLVEKKEAINEHCKVNFLIDFKRLLIDYDNYSN